MNAKLYKLLATDEIPSLSALAVYNGPRKMGEETLSSYSKSLENFYLKNGYQSQFARSDNLSAREIFDVFATLLIVTFDTCRRGDGRREDCLHRVSCCCG